MTIITQRNLATLGLTLATLGSLLLYWFGLPPDVRPKGESYLELEGEPDAAEVARGKRYGRLGRLGILLIAIGSAVQLWSEWVP